MNNLIEKIVSVMPKPLQELYHKYEDIILYVFYGGLTTVISFASQFLATAILGGGEVQDAISTAFSWICSVTFAFFTNKKYVFKSVTNTKKAFWTELFEFYGARAFSLLLEVIIIEVFHTKLKFKLLFVKLGAQIVILVTNYALSKFIIFKDKSKKAH